MSWQANRLFPSVENACRRENDFVLPETATQLGSWLRAVGALHEASYVEALTDKDARGLARSVLRSASEDGQQQAQDIS